MRIVLIADTFPPLRSSGAVQLRDLSREIVRQGHSLCVLLPAYEQAESWKLEHLEGARILRLKTPKIKDINYVRRTFAEFAMPFAMWWNLRKSPLADERWDGVIWYSPSIFFGPLVNALKKRSKCKSYLIIRDIFPEWAVDMGLMGKGLPYRFFKAVANYQYETADIIGVQTKGNLSYFERWNNTSSRTLEVLNNWLDKPSESICSINLNKTTLANRKILVYAGNMGVAQGMDILIELVEKLQSRPDVGFVFVGRGSDIKRLKEKAEYLSNILFFNEIHPDEIPSLYAQCHIGIVALDHRHKSHNIPGKFLTYIQSGLPVLANINPGNDLASIIKKEDIGQVCETNQLAELTLKAYTLIDQIETDKKIKKRCERLFENSFSTTKVCEQVIKHFS